MNDPNRTMKWLMMLALVVLSIVILYPPGEKLKGGIDLVGGSSLLYEIDTTGLDANAQRDLSSRVMNVLKDRVDPKGQLNLEWRPVGSKRLEIRMPRPPKEAFKRRELYNAALAALSKLNLARFDVESAINDSPGNRQADVKSLAYGMADREALLDDLLTKYTAFEAQQASGETSAASTARQAYEAAMNKVLATSLPLSRLTDVLALPIGDPKRDKELQRLRDAFPSYDATGADPASSKLLTKAVKAYDLWAANKAELEDPSDLKRRLKGAGVLDFRILAERDPSSPGNTTNPVQQISKYTQQLAQRGRRPKAGDRYRWIEIDNPIQFLSVDNMEEFDLRLQNPNSPIIEEYAGRYYVLAHDDAQFKMLQHQESGSQWELVQAYPDRNIMTGQNVVSFQLNVRGGQLFGELTGNNVHKPLCIVLDDKAMSSANINERITDRCQISGTFTVERVQNLVRTLEAGALPARLKETPLSEQTIGPSLGENNRNKGMSAAFWALISVAVLMVAYYGVVAGGLADVALALNLLFVLAAMALMQATFTLPGIAALILTVGMAVDANVLIFERFREERDKGVIFKKALNAGYDKALSTIVDANLTTLLTAVILGFVGSEEVKGFAIVLGLGIVTSMFTSLFVTRLVFNTLISAGWLKDLSMRRFVGVPSVDWLGKWRTFAPMSVIAVLVGLSSFGWLSTTDKEAVFDIEFLGGTSVQVDLLPGQEMTDVEMKKAITSTDGKSAVVWLADASEQLREAKTDRGDRPGQFTVTSDTLSGAQIVDLLHGVIEDTLERDGLVFEGNTATFNVKAGRLDMEGFKAAIVEASLAANKASERLRSARIQAVGDIGQGKPTGASYNMVTTETDRRLVQAAVMAVMGDKLAVQRKLDFSVRTDDAVTREPFFVVESSDQYLSDVIGGEASFDIRRYRGGAAIVVTLADSEQPISIAAVEKRMLELALQPEFEQLQTLESRIIGLGEANVSSDGEKRYKRFAVLAIDESLMYDDGRDQWTELLAKPKLAQVEAALGSEKSLSKVITFAPQVAAQTKNRAIFATILALASIVAYLWLRFGTKEYGLAAIVCLVHDVGITLGLIALSHFVYDSMIGKVLLLSDFHIDLPMIAALLTVVGYSLNDTIVVFDRIRENKGKVGKLSPRLINNSINQTLARTLLTSLTTLLVVVILYVAGGPGVHGFAFALMIGVVAGTYSSIGVAAPLLHRPALLYRIVIILVTLAIIGIIMAEVPGQTARLITVGIVAAGGLAILLRGRGQQAANIGSGKPART